jgi:hypothetical protein|tara:strand:+ start:774 stop:929 length:156 start_codon:yes stop_codon:yes gene_type:complete
MKNHGLIKIDPTLLMQIKLRQERKEKEKLEEEALKKGEGFQRPLWRSDYSK